MTTTGCVALVPARAGSRRVAGKNVRRLGAHPLLAYTIAAARESEVFDAVVVSTDDASYAAIARHYGAEAPFLRPAALSGDTSTDIEWIVHALSALADDGRVYETFSILRPTSPFRSADTIRRAWAAFADDAEASSLRAVEPVAQHPGKMWRVMGRRIVPILPVQPAGTPWHSSPTQSLPEVFVQNASLEIARTRVALVDGSIAGEEILPFHTDGIEGFDINAPRDWDAAVAIVEADPSVLPPVDVAPYQEQPDG